MAESETNKGSTAKNTSARKPKSRYNQKNINAARSQINRGAAPVPLDDKFLGFTSVERGNARVTINHNVTEILGNDYRDTISAGQSNRGLFDQNGNPYELDYLTRGLTGGFCLSIALKMIQATPASKIPQIATFRSFKEYQLQVPRNFIQIIDLIGKTDYQDWVIRIDNNLLTIKRMFLKCLKYYKQNADFIDDYVYLDQNELGRFNGLDNLTMRSFSDIYFDDEDSVKSIKKRARAWLDERLATRFEVPVHRDDNDPINVVFSYPQLPSDLTPQNIVTWLQTFVQGIHPDYNNILLTGALLLIKQNWLENINTAMRVIDPIFDGTAIQNNTPLELLNACGLHFYSEYLTKPNFITLSRSCFTYYESKITQRLKSLIHLVNQAPSTLGSPAQLVLIPEDQLFERNDHGMHRFDLNRNLNHCISYVKLATDSSVIKSAMINLVEDVDLNPDYEGHFKTSLFSIRKAFLSTDGLLTSQQRMY
jgi:hypothetical protein